MCACTATQVEIANHKLRQIDKSGTIACLMSAHLSKTKLYS